MSGRIRLIRHSLSGVESIYPAPGAWIFESRRLDVDGNGIMDARIQSSTAAAATARPEGPCNCDDDAWESREEKGVGRVLFDGNCFNGHARRRRIFAAAAAFALVSSYRFRRRHGWVVWLVV